MKNESNKSNKKVLQAAGIVFAAFLVVSGVGFALIGGDSDTSSSNTTSEDEAQEISEDSVHSEHSDSHSEDHSHSETYEFANHDELPEVSINNIGQNLAGEWVMLVDFLNFDLRQDKVDQENVPGEGHAHVYVNDKKVSRLFSSEYTFEDPLNQGDMIRVGLNTNDHKGYTHDGQLIQDTEIVQD